MPTGNALGVQVQDDVILGLDSNGGTF